MRRLYYTRGQEDESESRSTLNRRQDFPLFFLCPPYQHDKLLGEPCGVEAFLADVCYLPLSQILGNSAFRCILVPLPGVCTPERKDRGGFVIFKQNGEMKQDEGEFSHRECLEAECPCVSSIEE